jgi:predicted outer membrane repeat protein
LRLLGAALLAAFALASFNARAGGFGILTIYRVGLGAGCDFNNLQAALNAASQAPEDATEIRISSNLDSVAVFASNRNLRLDGRYASCTSSTPDEGLRRTLAGTGSDNVLNITASQDGPRREFTVRNLVIRGGGIEQTNGFTQGGGLRAVGRVDADLINVRVGDNEATQGGGIYVSGGVRLMLDGNTIVGNDASGTLTGNRATGAGTPFEGRGGGLYCLSSEVTIRDARFRFNASTEDGGALWLDNCRVDVETRPDYVDAGNVVTLLQNTAARNGGGLYAQGGSEVFWRSENEGRFAGRATGNRADASGGALFLTAASSFVGRWMRFEDSEADDRGGAVALEQSSNLILQGGAGLNCGLPRCPGIFGTRGITIGNDATLVGGAIHAESGAVVSLSQQHIYDNFARTGSALRLRGAGTQAALHTVLIARNVLYAVGNTTSTIGATESAQLQLRFVTMAGNLRASAQFPLVERALSSLRVSGSTASADIRNSVFWEDAVEVFRSLDGVVATGSCVIAHEAASLPQVQDVDVIDPRYVAPTATTPDYRLREDSALIDFCPSSGVTLADAYGVPRPQDLPRFDYAGPFDAGAFEYTDQPGLLFADGFED